MAFGAATPPPGAGQPASRRPGSGPAGAPAETGTGPARLAVLRRLPAETAARVRDWSRVLAVGLGVGALAGAGQLGVAYGLGLVRFARSFPSGGLWSAQLTWVAWFAALATLAGAAVGARTAQRFALARQLGGRVLLAAAAGLGAGVVVPLTALPAGSATLIGRTTASPALEAALAAGLGMVVGVLAAVATLSERLIAVSVTLLVASAWLLALLSVTPSLAPTAALPEVRLGVLDLPALGGARSPVAVLSAPVLALLICGAIAVAARSRGLSPLLTAVSSTAAPGLLALVYLVGSPGTGDRSVQAMPYAGALIAVATGLLASLVIGVVRLPSSGGGPAVPDTYQLPVVGAADPRVTTGGLLAPDEPAGPSFPPPEWPAPAGRPGPPGPPERHAAAEPAAPAAPAALPPPPPAAPREPPPPPEPARPAPEPSAAAGPPGPPPGRPEPTTPEPPTRRAARPRLPRLPRLPRPRWSTRAAGPEPAPAASEPVSPPAPAPAAPAPAPAPPAEPPSARRRGRRREQERDDHVDWISSLAGQAGADQPEPGRRRLRQDRDEPDAAAGPDADPPTRPGERGGESPPYRPYVSPDHPAPKHR